MTSNADHCYDLVRAGDKDRYLASLFAPDDKRPHLLALHAFNLEITCIRNAVSEPHIGLIRQQWWLDTLDGIYAGNVPAHPVAQQLARAAEAANLPKPALHSLVTAREFDLYSDPMPSLEALETYLGETTSTLIQLSAIILVGAAAKDSAEAAGLAGVAYGLARLLHKQPVRHLPPGMTMEDAIGHARQRLAEARALRHKIPPAALPAFLPVALTELYLARAAGARGVSQFRRQMAIWWAARRNRF